VNTSSQRGWASTVTTATLAYGRNSSSAADGAVDDHISCDFWKAALQLLQAAERGCLAEVRGGLVQGRSLRIRFGSNPEVCLECVSNTLLTSLEAIEVSLERQHE